MKPNDLRIGNIVKLRDTGEIVRVCGLAKSKIGFHAPNERPNAQLRYRKYCEIEPVLIHPDKAESSDLFDSILDNNPRITAAFYESDALRMRMDFSDVECGIKVPDYLHELQNIHHALTGEELEIEL